MNSKLPNIPGYTYVRDLGKGTAGKVYLVHDKNGMKYALKFLTMGYGGQDIFDLSTARREVNTLIELNKLIHGVPYVYHYDLEADEPYICFDYIGGMTLEELIQDNKLDLSTRLSILEELAALLDTVHSKGIVHRDIKPSNIKQNGDKTYLLDFGISFSAETNDHTTGVKGTPRYAAPEPSTDASYDRFAYSIVTFELLFGIHPFFTTAEAEDYRSDDASLRTGIIRKITKKAWRFPSALPRHTLLPEMQNETFLKKLDEIFAGMFCIEPEDRRYHKARDLYNAIKNAIPFPSGLIDHTDYRGSAPLLSTSPTSEVPIENATSEEDTTVYGDNTPSLNLGRLIIGIIAIVIILFLVVILVNIISDSEDSPPIAGISSTDIEPVSLTTVPDLVVVPTENPTVTTDAASSLSNTTTATPSQDLRATSTVTIVVAVSSLTSTPEQTSTETQTTVSLLSPSATSIPSATYTLTPSLTNTTIPTRTFLTHPSETSTLPDSGNVQGDIMRGRRLEEQGANVKFDSGYIELECDISSSECINHGWIDLQPITNGAYFLCMSAPRCVQPSGGIDGTGASANAAITNVTKRMAESYCLWRGEKLGRTTRLPTQTELSHAQQVFGNVFSSDISEWTNGVFDATLIPSELRGFRCFEPIHP